MTEQTQTPKPKMALCALDEDIQKALVDCARIVTSEPKVELVLFQDELSGRLNQLNEINKMPTQLVDRIVCDDKVNIDVGRRQLLPYITYTQDIDDNTRVLIYKRGKRGDESRLHNLWSIGVGGHVEGDNANGQLVKTLFENMHQETLEEIGVDVSTGEFVKSLFNSMFILDSRQNTEIVHCGISVKVELFGDINMTFEQGTIVEPQWVDVRTLKEMVTSGTIVLEAWSQLVLKYAL